ncbi:MAG: hydantoinase B/oxoprolinase family protein [Acidobacteriota bacterium]|jgi:N-methylhydantoinase B|nr:hydantoinase B/oxoprolinase family protein [Acidobacteriota bacterium]MEC7900338.1 hydantoinase B/oxoprolinase family protein [Acidobacteriota bacterium]MEC8943842.1 hydantoinase B/oxoprolinase family protein [Acidobacteriota bacterium]MEE3273639.1 hydantoinase B/oxoprolinase family protein [Acidobacteriota bacterium]
MNSPGSPADFFTRQIIRNALTAVGEDMFVALQRTSMSPIIYETLDYAVGITDADGELIAQGNGVITFLGTLDTAVKSVLDRHADIRPGDSFITNDPYEGGGTHLSDVTLVQPVFHGDKLIAFVANKAHWTEVGGMDPGSWTTNSTSVFQEGLQFPTIRLGRDGKIFPWLLTMLGANVRLPEQTLGDLWAGVAANRIGAERIGAVIDRYGADTVVAAMNELLEYGETMARAALAELPKGVFEAADKIDSDGHGNGPFDVQVKVTITDDEFIVDFTGSSPQVAGPINNPRTSTNSRVRAIFRAVTAPNLPTNGGFFRPLKTICPDGTVFSAIRPAPTSTYWEAGGYVTDLVWQALAPHLPERLPAGCFLSVCATIISATDPHTGDLRLLVEPLVGGWGAGHERDGDRGQFCQGNGLTYNIPIEVTEQRYPVRVRNYSFHTEPGGAGEFRGGNGVVIDYEILAKQAWLTAILGRHDHPPWGICGGHAGSGNEIRILRGGSEDRVESYSSVARFELARGDVVRLVTGTGGGYGDPRHRTRERVVADVRSGYITIKQAHTDYGFNESEEP